jgi:hypothetical protein
MTLQWILISNSFLISSYVYKNIAGRLVLVDKAFLEELVPADQQIPGRAAVASAYLGCGLVGWC